MCGRRLGSLSVAAAVLAAAAGAQTVPPAGAPPAPRPVIALPQSPILTVDQDRLYSESLWGKRAEAELQAESRALQAENNRIEGELTAEEKALTEQRATLDPQAFRKLADDFDQRVTGIRAAQDRKAADIGTARDRSRQEFLAAALPVMARLLTDHGAVAILDNRAVFVSARSVDATDELLKALDDTLGAGPAPVAPAAPAPAAPAAPAPAAPTAP